MKFQLSKLGLTFSSLYALLCIFTFIQESNCHGGVIDLCGLGLALLAMPFTALYSTLAGHYFDRGPELNIVFIVGAIINIFILYYLGKLLGLLASFIIRKLKR